MSSIGSRIRETRVAQRKSLNDIASRAKISAATLSRIETEKQGVGITLFLLIAKVLKVHPNELLGEPDGTGNGHPVAETVAGMNSADRAHLWRELAVIHRDGRKKRESSRPAEMSAHIEELLAQIDYLRQEVDAMRTHMTIRKSRR